jgi:hypothetical protein
MPHYRGYAASNFAVELDESTPPRVLKLGILIGLLSFLLLFLLAFLLFGPEGDVRSFFDVILPGDPTFLVRSEPDGDVLVFGDGANGNRLPHGTMPYCEPVMTQDKLGGSFFDVFFDVFFWVNKTRPMVGSNPLCGGDQGGDTQPASNPETSSGDQGGVTQPASNPETSSGGHCQDKCDPNISDCLAGLKCQPSTPGSTDFICWDQTICTAPVQVEVTDQATESKGCGDGVCDAGIGESAITCPADCGLCGNNFCDPGESVYTCTPDCGEPPSGGDGSKCKCVNGVLSCDKSKKC